MDVPVTSQHTSTALKPCGLARDTGSLRLCAERQTIPTFPEITAQDPGNLLFTPQSTSASRNLHYTNAAHMPPEWKLWKYPREGNDYVYDVYNVCVHHYTTVRTK